MLNFTTARKNSQVKLAIKKAQVASDLDILAFSDRSQFGHPVPMPRAAGLFLNMIDIIQLVAKKFFCHHRANSKVKS